MGQGDASTVTMTFVGAGAVSAEVSADIVCAPGGWAGYMSNFYVVGGSCFLFVIRNTTVLVRST